MEKKLFSYKQQQASLNILTRKFIGNYGFFFLQVGKKKLNNEECYYQQVHLKYTAILGKLSIKFHQSYKPMKKSICKENLSRLSSQQLVLISVLFNWQMKLFIICLCKLIFSQIQDLIVTLMIIQQLQGCVFQFQFLQN